MSINSTSNQNQSFNPSKSNIPSSNNFRSSTPTGLLSPHSVLSHSTNSLIPNRHSLNLSSNNNNIIHFRSISQASHRSSDLHSPKFKSSQLSPPHHIHSNHLASTHSTISNIDSSDQNPTSVQVILRIRPPNFDINVPSRFQRIILNPINSTTVSIETSPPSISNTQSNSNNKSTQKFTFDRVFSQQDDQLKIWSSVQGLINRFIEGYNVTVFAYGQTSSGKSYTMGTDPSKLIHQSSSNLHQISLSDHHGIIPRSIDKIFETSINQTQLNKSNKSTIKASYVEIYNEDLIDLIASSQSPTITLPQVTIREDKDGNIIWSGLREVQVSNSIDAINLLQQGSLVRQTNSTEMNSQSSRSHAIFSLSLSQRRLASTSKRNKSFSDSNLDQSDWVTVTSKFHFVDLAGSERLKRTAAVGGRIKEGISINSGLHALGNVISALGDPSKAKTVTHIPYRDSKLTRLLQDSLGGNACTLMIACVSPSEWNLSETLNTLKYANRARNIKNQAQVNATEAGWEDIEYLQSTILKLRKEMSILKNSGSISDLNSSSRSLSAIEEDNQATDITSSQYLELKGHFTELQSKYAKALLDLTQAQNSLTDPTKQSDQSLNQLISPSTFEQMIQPIVEEYEKSITALESQLALIKTALVHSEQSIKQLESKLVNEQLNNENQANLILDLKDRLNRLIERESENEKYIKDLESQMKKVSDTDEASILTISDLKKDLNKLKEQDLKSEAYIKDLESNLLNRDPGHGETLIKQIEELQTSLTSSEERYETLKQRFDLLSSHLSARDHDLVNQQKDLVDKLLEKEKKIEELQVTLNQLEIDQNNLKAEKDKLELDAMESSKANIKLSSQLKDFECNVKFKQIHDENSNVFNSNSQTINFTPPSTPAINVGIGQTNLNIPSNNNFQSIDKSFLSRFQELQEKYENTVGELDQVKLKYNNSCKEIQDLSIQLDESKLLLTFSPNQPKSISHSTNDLSSSQIISPSPSPSPIPQSPSLANNLKFSMNHSKSSRSPIQSISSTFSLRGSNQEAMNNVAAGTVNEVESSMETLQSPPNAHQELFNRPPSNSGALARDSINTRRPSYPNNISSSRLVRLSGGINLAKSNLSNTQSPHGRSISLSLSQDSLPLFINPSNNSISNIVRTSSISRSNSPIIARTNSLNIDQLSSFNNNNNERSYESLEKEVLQLQEVLKDREAEILSLEQSIRQLNQTNNDSFKSKPETLHDKNQNDPTGFNELIESGILVELKNSKLDQINNEINSSNSKIDSAMITNLSNYDSMVENPENIKRLDDLMRSMAQKESAHLELIETLKEELKMTQRQHDELVKLSRDQVVNMSSEIEALRDKLTRTESNEQELIERLKDMEESLILKQEELDKVKTDFNTLILNTESKLLAAKQAEIEALSASEEKVLEMVDQIELKWQTKLDSKLKSQADLIRQEFENEYEDDKRTALKDQEDRFEREIESLIQSHNQELESLKNQLKKSLQKAESDFSSRLKQANESNEREMENHVKLIALSRTDENNGVEELVEVYQTKLSVLQSQRLELEKEKESLVIEHSKQVDAIRSEYETKIQELNAEHEEILVGSLTELDQRRTRKFAEELKLIQENHHDQINRLEVTKQKEMEKIMREFGSKLNKNLKEIDPVSNLDSVANIDQVQKIKREYEEKIQTLENQRTHDLAELEAKILGSNSSLSMIDERLAYQRKIDMLSDELDYLKEEVQKNPANGSQAPNGVEVAQNETEVELQEALDALSTLDKALLESQAERERLLKELNSIKKSGSEEHANLARDFAELQSEFNRLKQERDDLLQNKERLGDHELLASKQNYFRSDSPSRLGLASRNHLLANAKPPPPTPPPSIPPPPLPTTLAGLTTTLSPLSNGLPPSSTATVRQATSASNSSSQVSQTNNSASGCESPSTSVGTHSQLSGDLTVQDSRMIKKIEEQENELVKLSKQLSEREVQLKANLDLVGNLELSLNDAERNLRKSRVQMTELAKERDKLISQNEILRKDLIQANLEVENVRNNVLAEKVQFENQLGEERRAKENAKRQLESRLEEMQASKMTRKSKFNCF